VLRSFDVDRIRATRYLDRVTSCARSDCNELMHVHCATTNSPARIVAQQRCAGLVIATLQVNGLQQCCKWLKRLARMLSRV